MINILQIPDQYFFVLDRERYDAILSSLALVRQLRAKDTEEQRTVLKEVLDPVFGFREAGILHTETPSTLEDALQEKKERQLGLKRHLEERFTETVKDVGAKHPPDYPDREVRRGAVFYTMHRTPLIAIAEGLETEYDWEGVAGEIATGGKKLGDYFSPELTKDVLAILPSAIVFNEARQELISILSRYGLSLDLDRLLPKPIDLGLPEEQRHQVEGMLERLIRAETDFAAEFKGLVWRLGLSDEQARELKTRISSVVKGSALRLARSLDGLRYGRVDEKVLNVSYRNSRFWISLAEEISMLGLRESDIEHVHTRNLRYSHTIWRTWLRGEEGLGSKLIEFLGIKDVGRWSVRSGIQFLDPIIEPDAETVGLYIGHFLFGSGTTDLKRYSPKNKGREWFLNLVERIGKLKEDYSTDDDHGTYVVPSYVTNLAKFGLDVSRKIQYPNNAQRLYLTEMHRAALRAWLTDRATQLKDGVSYSLKARYEKDIRRLASEIGLGISEGGPISERKIMVYVRNPEVVGYMPNQ